ncbi:DUF2652 domain-containing protein [Spirosoma sp. KNUC1025]|uniref:DUF2652 domain-containing protein n=1 Tax=Spirosoma sp. KNUC1025 TaxID=2894082 RepID=UPI00386B550B|nr:DUF2652 domain-containing protein [Spirosoma sp. KNUC1025]
MAESNATILIPDISGFTEFMTTTELGHASRAINILIEAILSAIGGEYDVSEIEGDAVLLIKKGPAPSKKEILDSCLKIFNAFHFQRKWIQHYSLCPCRACQSIMNLTLKFVVHHGPLFEIKVGGFVKQSGPDMIVAHRLLKNDIDNHEYLLMTEKLLQQMADSTEVVDREWARSSAEYASIGKVDYHFTLLNEARNQVPEPPEPPSDYRTDDTPYLNQIVAADYRDVYRSVMNISSRLEWLPGLEAVESDIPDLLIGNVHRCRFNDYQAIISPIRMSLSNEKIIYAESCRIDVMNLSLVYEFIFKNTDESSCEIAARFLNTDDAAIPESVYDNLLEQLQHMMDCLKVYCETI